MMMHTTQMVVPAAQAAAPAPGAEVPASTGGFAEALAGAETVLDDAGQPAAGEQVVEAVEEAADAPADEAGTAASEDDGDAGSGDQDAGHHADHDAGADDVVPADGDGSEVPGGEAGSGDAAPQVPHEEGAALAAAAAASAQVRQQPATATGERPLAIAGEAPRTGPAPAANAAAVAHAAAGQRPDMAAAGQAQGVEVDIDGEAAPGLTRPAAGRADGAAGPTPSVTNVSTGTPAAAMRAEPAQPAVPGERAAIPAQPAASAQAPAQGPAQAATAATPAAPAQAPVETDPGTAMPRTDAAASAAERLGLATVRSASSAAAMQSRIELVAEQLAARLRLSQAAGGTQVHLSLRPRELGDVQVQLAMRDGHVAALVVADRAETARLLQQDSGDLRRLLEGLGLRVDQLDVNVRDGDAGAAGWRSGEGQDAAAMLRSARSGADEAPDGSSDDGTGMEGARPTADDVHDGSVSLLA